MPLGFQRQSPHQVHCDLCKRVVKYPYVVTLGGMPYNFCSSEHAVLAEKNFKEKENIGVHVTAPKSMEEDMYEAE